MNSAEIQTLPMCSSVVHIVNDDKTESEKRKTGLIRITIKNQ